MGHFGRLPHLPSVTDLAIHDATARILRPVRMAAAGDFQAAFARPIVAATIPSMARVALR